MEKTPTVAKSKKSLKTPKTASNQQNATPKMDSNLVLGTRQSLRRTKLGIVAGASPQVAPFYTPGRTTRSMLKVTSDDVLPSYVTPLKSSKRKTVASARTSVVRNNDAQQDDGDKFVRPIPPRTKREDKFQADSTVVDKISTISESVEALSNSETKKDRERARKTAKTNQPSNEMVVEKKRTNRKAKPVKEMVAESSEEDWPSVSILGSTDTPTAQYVRTRKSLAQQSTSSESQLNPNTSGQFVRSRKTDQDFSDNFASTEDDLPSVSFLGTSVTPDKLAPRRRSKLSIEPKANKTVSDVFDDLATKPKPNKRTSLSTRSQKSNQTVEVAIESELKDLPSNELPEQHRKSVQFVRSRKSRKNIIDKNEQTEESTLNGHEENNSTNIESTNMSIDEDDQNNVPSIAVISTKSDVGAGSNVDEDLLKSKMEMPLKKSRISVIDLTDSPFIQNKSVLNETFTPEKEETTVNGGDSEANNQTFTEENNKTAVNDATFSPVPSSDKKVALTPAPTKDRASLNAAAKSTAKKKSPLLKRLQSTPYLKLHARNNLVAPGKLSSAKKAKVVEAAIESIEPPKGKSMDKVKELKVAIESPKVFKFGEQDNKNALFRFSLCAPHLQGRQETGGYKVFIWSFL